MKVAVMLSDIAESLVNRPITERYPFERRPAPARLRGRLIWSPENCSGCGLCAMDCPAQAIQVHILDKKSKRFVLEFHLDRCTFCAQCVHSCRQGCLELSHEAWELAAIDPSQFVFYWGDPEDVRCHLAGEPAGGPEPPVSAA